MVTVKLIAVTYDRKTLKHISRKVINVLEVKEDQFYLPLVESFYNCIKNQYKKERGGINNEY